MLISALRCSQLISGLVPYYHNKQPHTVMLDIRMNKKPRRAKYADFEKYALQPDQMWVLLERCWEVEPEDRLTIDEVLVELERIQLNPTLPTGMVRMTLLFDLFSEDAR
jgi:hypothetical protein